MDINFENMSDLNRTVSGAFREAFQAPPTPAEWPRIARLIRSGSSSNLYDWLGATDGMREWLGDAVFDQLSSGRYSIVNRKFQKGLEADRDQIRDDNDGGAGLYTSMATIVGNAAASHPDELVIGETLAQGETLLGHDGQPYFDTDHPNQNGDGGVQSNLISGGGTPWYLMDTSKPLRPLIYQLREDFRVDGLTNLDNPEQMRSHKFYWNGWMRDAAGFGPFWLAVKSYATLDEAGLLAAEDALLNMHMGVKDPLTGTYRKARNRATLLVCPTSLRSTARKLLGQPVLASGESNFVLNAVDLLVSDYL